LGGGVTVVDCGGLDAIVSWVPLGEYESPPGEDRRADPDWVIPRALRHERVVEAVAARSVALPARFGSLFSTEGAVARLAALHRERIAAFLDEVDGKDEWSFRVEFEPDPAADHFMKTDPALAEKFRALPEAPGARFFKEKALRAQARILALGAAVAAAGEVRDRLATFAGCRVLPPRRPEVPGREMLLNLACLLPRGDADDAAQRAREAAAGAPLELVVTGPWPPFNFCPDLNMT
jgi:gas vesicle protein GvpL/GvpF